MKVFLQGVQNFLIFPSTEGRMGSQEEEKEKGQFAGEAKVGR